MILTGLWASIGVTHYYLSCPFSCAHGVGDSERWWMPGACSSVVIGFDSQRLTVLTFLYFTSLLAVAAQWSRAQTVVMRDPRFDSQQLPAFNSFILSRALATQTRLWLCFGFLLLLTRIVHLFIPSWVKSIYIFVLFNHAGISTFESVFCRGGGVNFNNIHSIWILLWGTPKWKCFTVSILEQSIETWDGWCLAIFRTEVPI